MSNSKLATIKVPAYSGNYTKGRSKKIAKITIHHMAAVLSAKECGKIFQKKGRNGSSHYGIGKDGEIALYVDEANTAWTDSNWDSNCKSVTIENSNSKRGGDWPVGKKTLNSLIKLCADIAKRNNLGKLKAGKNLTWHSMYAATTCVPIDTELLTREGWKPLKEIEVGEDVAAAHIDDLSIRFSPVLTKVPEKKQDTWEVRGLETTADHRILWKNQGGKTWRVNELQDLPANRNFYVPSAGFYSGNGLPLSDNEIKLLIAVQADGHYEHGDKSGKDRVTFHMSKQRKIKLLDEILNPYDYKKYCHADGTVSYNVKGIKTLCDEWLDDKKFTTAWLELTPKQAELFLDTILDFDGCRAGQDYSSSKKQNIDIVDAIAALNGVGFRHDGDCRTAFTGATRTVGIESQKKRHQQRVVSCVTVESGFVLIRQHGRSTIIGNCPGNYLRSKMDYIAEQANLINYPKTEDLKVGDKVKITAKGNSRYDGKGKTCNGVGFTRYIQKIFKGKAYPYQVGAKGGATTGYYKKSALKEVK